MRTLTVACRLLTVLLNGRSLSIWVRGIWIVAGRAALLNRAQGRHRLRLSLRAILHIRRGTLIDRLLRLILRHIALRGRRIIGLSVARAPRLLRILLYGLLRILLYGLLRIRRVRGIYRLSVLRLTVGLLRILLIWLRLSVGSVS